MAWDAYDLGNSGVDLGPMVLGRSLVWGTTSINLKVLDPRTGAFTLLTDKFYGLGGDDMSFTVGSDGLLYVFSPDLFAVDMRQHRVVRWIDNGSFVVPPVAIGGGSVVIRDYFGTILRLDPKPRTQTYDVAWAVEEPGGADQGMRLLYDAERRLVYADVIGDDTHPGATVALRTQSGAVAWSTPWSGGELSLVGQGLLLRAAGRPGDLTGSFVHVQLLDRDTGAVRYDYAPPPASDRIRYVAADRTGDRVYVTSDSWVSQGSSPPVTETTLTALDAHLKPLWHWTTPKATVAFDGYTSIAASRPAVGDDGSVYLTTTDCHVWALSRDGAVMWVDHQPYWFVDGADPPLLYDGRLYTVSSQLAWEAGKPPMPHALLRAYRVAPSATSGALGVAP